MSESFASYVYRHLLEEEGISEDDLSEEDVATAEDALSLDELNITDDDLDTMSHNYRQQCVEQGSAVDYTGYEDYA